MNGVSVILTIYVDGYFVVGDKAEIRKIVEEIGKHFEIKRSQEINDLNGYKVRREDGTLFLPLSK
jgi:predicted RNA-binding protein with PIN domain